MQKVLIAYRTAPHAVTGRPPAEVMFGSPIPIRPNCMHPSIARDMEDSHKKQGEAARDRRRQFQDGEAVWARHATSCFQPRPSRAGSDSRQRRGTAGVDGDSADSAATAATASAPSKSRNFREHVTTQPVDFQGRREKRGRAGNESRGGSRAVGNSGN